MNYGMIRAAAASPKLRVADPEYNKGEILKAIDRALNEDVRVLVLPELAVTGATCGDLFCTTALQRACEKALDEIIEYTEEKNICVVVGAPYYAFSKVYDCAFVIQDGIVRKAVPKADVSSASPFAKMDEDGIYSEKYDVEISSDCVIDLGGGAVLGVEIGSDLMLNDSPSARLAAMGANIIVNAAACEEYALTEEYRTMLIKAQSARGICAYVYAGASVFESTTDSVFSGDTLIAENGEIIARGGRFNREGVMTIADIDCEKLEALRMKNDSFAVEDDCSVNDGQPLDNDDNDLKYRRVDAYPFIPSNEKELEARCREIFAIQTHALARRLEHVGEKGCIVGISGGLDSTLALLVSVEAMKLLGRPLHDIIGVTMPGFGTTDRSYNNAIELMESLGVSVNEISIKDACLEHFKSIGHNPDVKDITYENAQARERTQILFDMANKHGCLVVGTGDLSELAMGWCTYNGDHMSMYGVNACVPKTLVRHIVKYVASVSDRTTGRILLDVLDMPISPELLPPDENGVTTQKTEEKIGPYDLLDFFLYNFVRFGYDREKLTALAVKAFEGTFDRATVEKWVGPFFKRFFISQFKRSCSPDGPKVGSVSLSPRGDWNMPSDAFYNAFI